MLKISAFNASISAHFHGNTVCLAVSGGSCQLSMYNLPLTPKPQHGRSFIFLLLISVPHLLLELRLSQERERQIACTP